MAGYLEQYVLPLRAVDWRIAFCEEQGTKTGLTIADDDWVDCGRSASEESGKLEHLHDRA